MTASNRQDVSLTIRIPARAAERMAKTANKYGLHLDDLVREALVQVLEELDDIDFAHEALARIRQEPDLSLQDLRCSLDGKPSDKQ